MSEPVSAQMSKPQDVNALRNDAVTSTHAPSPCQKSSLNAQARQWWAASRQSNLSTAKRPQQPPSAANLQPPSNWPNNVVFITQNLIAPSVPESIAKRYVLQPSTSSQTDQPEAPAATPRTDLPRATHNDGQSDTLYTASLQEHVPLVIWPIDQNTPWDPESFHSTSRNLTCHPAAGSFGLFATDDIAANTFIRPYLGVLHTKLDADFHSTYDLSLCHDPRMQSNPLSADPVTAPLEALSLDDAPQDHDPTALYLDSRYWGNESRFVNDYRGIAPKPNVEFRSFHQPSHLPQQPDSFQMGLFATRPIRKGQELLINYGKSYWVHHQQLDQLQKPTSPPPSNPLPPASSAAKLDPIQAMLQRSRMRVSRSAVHPHRPPHQPSPRD